MTPTIPHQREALRRYVDTLGPRETWDAATEQAVAYLEERLAAQKDDAAHANDPPHGWIRPPRNPDPPNDCIRIYNPEYYPLARVLTRKEIHSTHEYVERTQSCHRCGRGWEDVDFNLVACDGEAK